MSMVILFSSTTIDPLLMQVLLVLNKKSYKAYILIKGEALTL